MLYTAFVLATLAASASAATSGRTFAVNHFYGNGFLTEGRMDPIVSPGTTSAHSHAIQGGSNFALTMDNTTLLDSTCTSSLIKNDNSVYWTPSLYFHDAANGSFISVPTFYMNVYYFFEETDDDIKAFQPGHRMFVGDSSLRTPPATGGGSIVTAGNGGPQPVQFTCPRSNYNTPAYPVGSNGLSAGIEDPNNQGAGVGFPDINCDGNASPLRADVHFPSCYNPAVPIDDYKNNMVFPTQVGAKQNCPEGYIHTPHIFYEVYWNTPLFVDMWTQGQGSQPFVLSNGDNTGYSLHGDFISGWDVETLQQIIDNCDAGDSGMDQCPGLIGGINDSADSCNIPSLIDEQVNGVLSALPGNNPVTGWGVSGSSPAAGSSSAGTATAPSSSAVAPAGSSSSAATSAVSGGYGAPSSASLAVSHIASSISASLNPTSVYNAADSSYVTPSFAASSSSPAETFTTLSTLTVSPIPAESSTAAPISSTPPTSSSSSSTPTTPVSATTATNPSLPGWSYAGCYSDNGPPSTAPRVLTGIQFAYMGLHNVSTTPCLNICAENGFKYGGTEYGGQCFCGSTLDSSSKMLDESECSMPCEGDESELCGGGLALSLFEMGASGSGSVAASSTSAVEAASATSTAASASMTAPMNWVRHPHFGRVRGEW